MGTFHSTSVFLESIRKGGRLVPPPTPIQNGTKFISPDKRTLRDTCQIALRDENESCAKSSSLQTCAKCKSVAYCWTEHQAADWKRHKLSCYKDLDP
ncbi:hypothetical protein BDY24DRAFT_417327 [Mrakia frigida]|uniref:zinc finger MYND domain-containing protein n=1 Tax=Mrakia frigida TaxID=29902 RepID=UPI003FCC1AB5